MPAVASTPITPVCELSAAGLTAGSIPMKRTGYSFLRVVIAAAVAVLHATTMIRAPRERRNSVIALLRFWMNGSDFSPYGQLALSA